MDNSPSIRRDTRGVSEVIGYVLVISLVISTVGIVSVAGVSILQDARSAEQINNAERAFDLLADNVQDIHQRGAPSRSTEIQLGSAQVVAQQTTTLNVSWNNETGAKNFRETPLASLTYRGGGDQRLVYDGGAVFRLSEPGQQGVALREPPFVTTEEGVVIAVPRLSTPSTSAVSGSTALIRTTRRGGSVIRQSGAYDDVWINVTSTHWQAWERTLDDRSGVNCPSSDPANDTVSCRLIGGNSPDRFYYTETLIRVELTR